MSVIEIIKRNFDNEVMFSDRPLLLEFFATDSDDCKAMADVICEVADENLGIKVCTIDVATEPEIAARFEVTSTPTFIAFKTGKVRARRTGIVEKSDILEMLKA